jgi:CheY-like chemotaxis protein
MTTPASRKQSHTAHILLVDDNRMGLSARRNVLEELGYKITSCLSAGEALASIADWKFNLIVTDYRMPVIDGIEFICRIRSHHPDMPIILISGFAETLGLDAKGTGADFVMQKSNHEVPTLVRAVQRLLARKTPKKPASGQSATSKVKRRTV